MPEAPLTDDEIKAIRTLARLAPDIAEIVESQKRVAWAFATLRVIAMWVTAVGAGFYFLRDLLKAATHG